MLRRMNDNMKSFVCSGKLYGIAAGVLLVIATSGMTSACNIPVFRYALERWSPDSYRMLIFHNGELNSSEQKIVAGFQKLNSNNGGTSNLEITLVDLQKEKIADDVAAVWKSLKQSPTGNNLETPYVVIQMPHAQKKFINCWHGTLQQASTKTIADSPARQKIAKRLLTGDSVVWLIIQSKDAKKNLEAKKLLQNQLSIFAKQLKIPEGVGAPGSELFSEVPLFIKFSVMEIDPTEPKESFFAKQLINLQLKSYEAGHPLVVPVFGKGRALEVIPLDQLDANLIGDLSAFLCGACSCQVKERNPGFDLLFSTNWEKSLFEEGTRPPKTESISPNQRTSEPELIPIPPGSRK